MDGALRGDGMRARLRDLSFRNKLLLAFLLIGVVPLLISTLLMLNIFRVTLAGNARDAAQADHLVQPSAQKGFCALQRLHG